MSEPYRRILGLWDIRHHRNRRLEQEERHRDQDTSRALGYPAPAARPSGFGGRKLIDEVLRQDSFGQ